MRKLSGRPKASNGTKDFLQYVALPHRRYTVAAAPCTGQRCTVQYSYVRYRICCATYINLLQWSRYQYYVRIVRRKDEDCFVRPKVRTYCTKTYVRCIAYDSAVFSAWVLRGLSWLTVRLWMLRGLKKRVCHKNTSIIFCPPRRDSIVLK